jgi:hypothetical protein
VISEKEDGLVEEVPQQQNLNRRCAYPECTTTLSVYNSDFMCFLHADERTRARYEHMGGPVRAARRDAAVEPSKPSTHHILTGSSLVVLRLIDP